jgi:hypothetical protein
VRQLSFNVIIYQASMFNNVSVSKRASPFQYDNYLVYLHIQCMSYSHNHKCCGVCLCAWLRRTLNTNISWSPYFIRWCIVLIGCYRNIWRSPVLMWSLHVTSKTIATCSSVPPNIIIMVALRGELNSQCDHYTTLMFSSFFLFAALSHITFNFSDTRIWRYDKRSDVHLTWISSVAFQGRGS